MLLFCARHNIGILALGMPTFTTKKERLKIISREDVLEIRVSIKKNTNVLIAMILACCLWIVSLYVFIRIELSLHYFWYKAGMILAIMGWFALGMTVASFFIWLFFGRERILLTKDYFITDKPLVFFYRRNFYDIHTISNIRIDIEIFKANRNGVWMDESRTVLKFDTENKLVTITRGITQEEAEIILLYLAQSPYLKEKQFEVVQKKK